MRVRVSSAESPLRRSTRTVRSTLSRERLHVLPNGRLSSSFVEKGDDRNSMSSSFVDEEGDDRDSMSSSDEGEDGVCFVEERGW